jgi:anti-anti-sigma regulatory factor
MQTLAVHTEGSGDRREVKVEGAICLSNVKQLQDCLIALLPDARQIQLNVAGLTDIDLSGIQLLCSAERTWGECGGTFALSAAAPWFQKKLSETGLREK